MSKLAIHGGSKAIPEDFKYPEWPIVTEEDKAVIQRVMDRRDFWGKENEEVIGLEKEYSESSKSSKIPELRPDFFP